MLKMLCLLLFLAAIDAAAGRDIWLSDLDLSRVRQGWEKAHKDKSVVGQNLKIGGRRFEKGIGTHANSEMNLDLKQRALRLTACVGLDDDSKDPKGLGSPAVRFIVIGDGRTLWQSPVMITGREPKTADLDVSGIRYLSLLVVMANNLDHYEHADWADAKIVMQDDTDPEVLAELPKENEAVVTQLFMATAKKGRPPVGKSSP